MRIHIQDLENVFHPANHMDYMQTTPQINVLMFAQLILLCMQI
jgi:hypothetical protein